MENLLFEINNDDTTRAVKIEIGIYFKNSAVLSFILILEINITGITLGSMVTTQPPIIMYQIYIFIFIAIPFASLKAQNVMKTLGFERVFVLLLSHRNFGILQITGG